MFLFCSWIWIFPDSGDSWFLNATGQTLKRLYVGWADHVCIDQFCQSRISEKATSWKHHNACIFYGQVVTTCPDRSPHGLHHVNQRFIIFLQGSNMVTRNMHWQFCRNLWATDVVSQRSQHVVSTQKIAVSRYCIQSFLHANWTQPEANQRLIFPSTTACNIDYTCVYLSWWRIMEHKKSWKTY